MKKLILIRGLPGSGKSTLAERMIKESYVHLLSGRPIYNVEADMYWLRKDGFYDFNASLLKEAHAWCLNRTKMYLDSNVHVIVSNTFTTFKELKPYVKLAHECDAELGIITLLENYGNIHNVPEKTLERMANRFESHESIMEQVNGRS